VITACAGVVVLGVLCPPSYYLTAPPEFETRVLPFGQVLQVCGFNTMGCAQITMRPCVVIIADGLPERVRNAMLAHEVAHCNGWPASHPRWENGK
jgi:hypothetical protein